MLYWNNYLFLNVSSSNMVKHIYRQQADFPVDIFLKLNRKSAVQHVSLMIATLCLVE